MELFGRKINNEIDLRIALNKLSVEECKSVGRLMVLEQKQKAEIRMSRERDPYRKTKMKALIDQGEYNFDLLFGPER